MKANRVGGFGAVADAQPAARRARPATDGGADGCRNFFQECGTDGVAEQGIVGAPLEPIGAAVLLVGPAGRQVGDAVDVVIDDRGVAEHRADHAVAVLPQDLDQGLQAAKRHEALPADCESTVRVGGQLKIPS